MYLIKVLNPNIANTLADLGFKYTTETQGEKPLYVFIKSDDLMDKLQSSFSKKDFFIDKTMNF